MDPLLAARGQMALSLAFHMVFAAVGIGMPALCLVAEGLWLRSGREEYRALARKWAKVTGLLFAVGAVSGTALSFELGLLWPEFMAFAGPMIGPAFALEGYAFFVEAIFLGLYLYGWDRLSPRAHWWTGVPVAVSGALSGILVVSANAWMQNPVGFELAGGRAVAVDPVRALFNPSWAVMAVHSTIASYFAVAFAVAGVYAWRLLRGRDDAYTRAALRISMAFAVVMAVLQPISGDRNAKDLSGRQPVKLAAMEALFETRAGAPLLVGGIPDERSGTVRFGLEIPKGLSFLATGDPNATVRGLNDFPRDEWPNVLVTHLAFQVMVGVGVALLGLSVLFWLSDWRRPAWARSRPMLWALVLAGPLGFVALEAGWIVTEVGRQPWIVYGIMRTADAYTPAPGVVATFWGFALLYLGLAAIVTVVLVRLGRREEPAARPEGGGYATD